MFIYNKKNTIESATSFDNLNLQLLTTDSLSGGGDNLNKVKYRNFKPKYNKYQKYDITDYLNKRMKIMSGGGNGDPQSEVSVLSGIDELKRIVQAMDRNIKTLDVPKPPTQQIQNPQTGGFNSETSFVSIGQQKMMNSMIGGGLSDTSFSSVRQHQMSNMADGELSDTSFVSARQQKTMNNMMGGGLSDTSFSSVRQHQMFNMADRELSDTSFVSARQQKMMNSMMGGKLSSTSSDDISLYESKSESGKSDLELTENGLSTTSSFNHFSELSNDSIDLEESSLENNGSDINILPFYSSETNSDNSFQHPYVKNRFD